MELLETRRPPGAFEQAASALLRRRGVRIGGVVAVAAVAGIGLATGIGAEDPTAATQPARAAPALPDGPHEVGPPPWVIGPDAPTEGLGWKLLGSPRVDSRTSGYVVRFMAVNTWSQARKPSNLQLSGRYLRRPSLRFSAVCTGFDNDATGALRPIRTVVQPDEEFLLRCVDTMDYSGRRPELLLSSLDLEAMPCEDEGRGGPV